MPDKCIANCLVCGNYTSGRCSHNFSILSSFMVGRREPREGYGIAVDIGTTTVVMVLLDLLSGKTVLQHSFMNPQRIYGQDVISRIYAANEGYLTELSRLITNELASGIDKMFGASKKIDEIVIAGNTVMIHLLLGQSCKSLGAFPFKPEYSLEKKYVYSDIFYSSDNANCLNSCPVKIIPWFTAYAGGDITAGLIYILQCRTVFRRFLLIDLGTNGEIALYAGGNVTVTSTAAGPAFEYCAQDHVVCASGVIHELAQLVCAGLLDETGLLKNGSAGYFSQKEIRSLQLAKSAVRSGLDILLESCGMTYNEIETVYIAGGIGQATDVNDAAVIGLIPQELACKAQDAGNSSLGGAVCMLLSPEHSTKEMQSILSDFIYINLAEHPRFNDIFAENMLFNVQ